MAHKLTKAYDDALKQFAARLPEPEVSPVAKPQTGAELLAEHPDMKQVDDKPIQPEKLYYPVTSFTRVNHLRQLRKAYKQGGQPAVVKYLQPYAEFLKQE